MAFLLKVWDWHTVLPHPQGNKPSRFYLFASESFIEFSLWGLKTILKAIKRHKASPRSPQKQTATRLGQWPPWPAAQCPSSAFTSSVKDLPLEIKHRVTGLPIKRNCNLFSLLRFYWWRRIEKEKGGEGRGEGKQWREGAEDWGQFRQETKLPIRVYYSQVNQESSYAVAQFIGNHHVLNEFTQFYFL